MKKILFLVCFLSLTHIIARETNSAPILAAVNRSYIRIDLHNLDCIKINKLLQLATLMSESKNLYYFESGALFIHKILFDKLAEARYFILEQHDRPSKKAYFYEKIGYIFDNDSTRVVYFDVQKFAEDNSFTFEQKHKLIVPSQTPQDTRYVDFINSLKIGVAMVQDNGLTPIGTDLGFSNF